MTDTRNVPSTIGYGLLDLLWFAGGSVAFLTLIGLGLVWLFHVFVVERATISTPARPAVEEVRQRGPVLPSGPRHNPDGYYLSSGPR